MAETNNLIQQVIEDLTSNESLLEMLETESATEMLNWGISMAKSVVEGMRGARDVSQDFALLPRLKAIRQTMRQVGNWAAGKYADPGARVQLREKLLSNFRTIFGADARLPSPQDLDQLINQVDDPERTPQEMISKLRAMFETPTPGGNRA